MLALIFSGFTASTSVKGTDTQAYFSLPTLLYSVSSASALILPLLFILTLIALLSFAIRQNNVGFLFLSISVVLYMLFLIAFSQETSNYYVYNALSAQLKEAGVKSFKKRDVVITLAPNAMCYISLVLGIALAALSLPRLNNRQIRSGLWKELEPYAFIAPHLLLFIIFFIIPAVYGIYAAFTKWDIFNTPSFVGLANFKTLFFDSENTYYDQLRNGLSNTFLFVLLSVPGCIILPLLLALALRHKFRGNKFYQGLFYLPALMSASSVMLAWEYFFKKSYGMMNNLFGSTANWFMPPYSWAMIVIITIWWFTGGNMVIYQSALAGIPQDHYEAASIDGANGWQKFWYITLPGMRYPLSYTLTTTIVAQFNVYAQVDILLGFENSGANAVLLMYIRDIAFTQRIAGMASSMALILGLCIALATFVQVRVMRESN